MCKYVFVDAASLIQNHSDMIVSIFDRYHNCRLSMSELLSETNFHFLFEDNCAHYLFRLFSNSNC